MSFSVFTPAFKFAFCTAEQIAADLTPFPEFKALAREPPLYCITRMARSVLILNFKHLAEVAAPHPVERGKERKKKFQSVVTEKNM